MFPPRRILAPVDFSSYSSASVAFAGRLAHQCGAELHVLHVQPALLDTVAQAQHIDLGGETRMALTAFVTDALAPHNAAAVCHVETGAAHERICAAAATAGADLIVMGPRGRSRLAATLLGSVTKGVLQHSACPVAVVPATWTPAADGGPDTGTTALIVGVEDARHPSDALLDQASRLAAALGAALHLVHAEDAPGTAADLERSRQALTDHLHTHHPPAKTTVHVERGSASDVLEAYASRAALGRGIVMLGAHGSRDGKGAFPVWRDTALTLIARAPLPFVACRP